MIAPHTCHIHEQNWRRRRRWQHFCGLEHTCMSAPSHAGKLQNACFIIGILKTREADRPGTGAVSCAPRRNVNQ